jgi:NodT family efflux transporter outer membrane factor (OMF) lipoprotein
VANPFPNRIFDNWATSFNVSWEIDFWGRFRRTIESADDAVEASVDDYDNVMVTLIGDLATAYNQYRALQWQLVYTKENIALQKGSLQIATDRWKAGQTSEVGVVQSTSLLEQLESTIPVLEAGLRQQNNQICVLLGIPPEELAAKLGPAPPPPVPPEIVTGVPADLIRRRPDLRSAERLIAAQNAQIGVAEANFYPAFFINGTIGYEAMSLHRLFSPGSFTGSVGPAFQWEILNYGRVLNNVRFQDFKTQELVASYQQNVLSAAQEVENGIIFYLNSRLQAEHLAGSVKAAKQAVRLVVAQYRGGLTDYTPVFVAEQFLAQQQVLLAQAQANIAQGLISTYRALGGGWEYRLAQEANPPSPVATVAATQDLSASPGTAHQISYKAEPVTEAPSPNVGSSHVVMAMPDRPFSSSARLANASDAPAATK